MTRSRSPVLSSAALALLLVLGCSRDLPPDEALAEARSLIEAGEVDEARIRLQLLLASHPETNEARVLAAQLALDGGQPQLADELLIPLSAGALAEPSVQALRWWVDIGLGRGSQVIEAVQAGGGGLERVERARILYAAARTTGTAVETLGTLREAAAAAPDDAMLAADIANLLADSGNLRQAEIDLDRFLAEYTGPEALVARAELRLRNGATDKAREDLVAALKQAPAAWPLIKRVNAELLLGDVALASGNVEEAKQQVAKLERILPGAVGTQLLNARIASLEGRLGEAAEIVERVADAVPGNPRIQYLLADAWLRSGNSARATDLLERRVREGDAIARSLLAGLLMRQNRPDRVIELLGDLPQEVLQEQGDQEGLLSAARAAQERASESLASLESRLGANPEDPEQAAELAFAYLRNGQANRALTLLGRSRREDPSPLAAAVEMGANFSLRNEREINRLVSGFIDPAKGDMDVLLAAADAAQEAGRLDVAARVIDRALQMQGDHPGALLRRANIDFMERRYDAAAGGLERLTASGPADPRVQLAQARVLEAQGDLPAAIKVLEAAIIASPASLEPGLMLAGAHLRANRPELAMQVLEKLVAAAPQDAAAALAAGATLLRAGNIDGARTLFRRAIDQQPESAMAWFNLGRAQWLIGDRNAAAQSFDEASELRPEWLDAGLAAVQAHLELKQPAAAAGIAQGLVKRMPAEPRAWMASGQAALAEGQPTAAAAAFGRSFALRSSAAAALSEHGARVAARAPRPDQPLINWLNLRPNDLPVRLRLAQFYLGSGAEAAATREFEAIVRQAPNDIMALNNLAWLLSGTDTARAETLSRRAFAIAPQELPIADTLGWVLIKAGKPAEAVPILARAVQGMPENRAVRFHYALALARVGDRDAAVRELQAALAGEVDFDGRDAARLLDRELRT